MTGRNWRENYLQRAKLRIRGALFKRVVVDLELVKVR
jgi:hypothetical protein